MTPRLRYAVLLYWYTLQYVREAEQAPHQDRGPTPQPTEGAVVVSLDAYRKKKENDATQDI